MFKIALVGIVAAVLVPPPGVAPFHVIEAAFEDIQTGNITGDLSGVGGTHMIGVFDNADMGLSQIGNVTLRPDDIFALQIIPGDSNADGVIDSTEISTYKQMITSGGKRSLGWVNRCNTAYGGFSGGEFITPADTLLLQAVLPKS